MVEEIVFAMEAAMERSPGLSGNGWYVYRSEGKRLREGT